METSTSMISRNKSRSYRPSKMGAFLPHLNQNRLTTQSSFGMASRRGLKRQDSVTDEDLAQLPTIDEMATNFNYQKNMQPFDMMDNDLQKLVEELKKQKKSKKCANCRRYRFEPALQQKQK